MRLQQTLSKSDVAAAQRAPKVSVDLTPYRDLINEVLDVGNVGAVIGLDEGDDEKAIRRGLTQAARVQAHNLRFRNSAEGTLKFVMEVRDEAKEAQRKLDAAVRKAGRDAEAASKGNAPKERKEKAA